MIVEVQVEELLAPTLLWLSVASTLGELADNPITSPTLPSLTPYIILAKAKMSGALLVLFLCIELMPCEGAPPCFYSHPTSVHGRNISGILACTASAWLPDTAL